MKTQEPVKARSIQEAVSNIIGDVKLLQKLSRPMEIFRSKARRGSGFSVFGKELIDLMQKHNFNTADISGILDVDEVEVISWINMHRVK